MKAHIVDAEMLRFISPSALYAYLSHREWRLVGRGKLGDVYAKTGGEQIIAPATTDVADYDLAIGRAISTISDVEERSELSVYRDLSSADTDLIRVRAPEAADDGTISIETGVNLFHASRELLLAAACSVVRPQRAFRAGKMREANEYLDKVRVGQTEKGSFILTILSPVSPQLRLSLFPQLTDEPFNRKVTLMLSSGLSALKDAILAANRGGSIEAFESRIESGVSANLCKAAASLIQNGKGLDISLSWALTRPAPDRAAKFSFTSADAEILEEAATVLRDLEPRYDENIEGFVTKLYRGEVAADGTATIRGSVDGKINAVKAKFAEDDYSIVVRAHDTRQPISVEGDLVRDGQRWALRNPRNVFIISKDGDGDTEASDITAI